MNALSCRHCPNTSHTTEWHEAHYSVKRETWSDIYQRGRKIPAEDHPGEPHHFDAVCRRCGKPGMVNVTILAPDEIAVIQPAAQPAPDPLREEALAVVMNEHRKCGPKFDGCYSHFPWTTHCRADGMTWPCDVDRIRAALASKEER